jgi:peroxiredoxin
MCGIDTIRLDNELTTGAAMPTAQTNRSLKPGDIAPDFELMNQEMTRVRLADFRGKKKVVLLFYPMDFSPVCTDEHSAIGPELGKIAPDDQTVVFGVSCDSPYCHAAFHERYKIPYDLLSDPTRKMVKAYGMFAGEEPYNCSKRGTVVINKGGKIAFYHEQEMGMARTVEEVGKAAAADIALQNRADEFGVSV